MQIVRTLTEVFQQLNALRRDGRSIALVPTMGGLHQGHGALLQKATQCADVVVASLFVNPLQFDSEDDFNLYPRTEDEDFEYLRANNVAWVFAPNQDVMVMSADNHDICVMPGALGSELCGKHRPGHFQGVLTIVAKLLNIFSPDVAVFGEKDYQQLFLIRQMAKQLNFKCQITAVATVREHDGLACSSRNVYLSTTQRKQAPLLYATLSQLASILADKDTDAGQYPELTRQMVKQLSSAGFRVDYLEVRDADTLRPGVESSTQMVILTAAWLGQARLIDNATVTRC